MVQYKNKFEEWAASKELDLTPQWDKSRFLEYDYDDIETQLFWECWQYAQSSKLYNIWELVYQMFAKLLYNITSFIRQKYIKKIGYYCHNCYMEFYAARPDGFLKLVVNCPFCNYQMLVGGASLDKPYTINPKIIRDDKALCQHGCHYAKPFGFVVMADCPIHA